MLCMTCASNTSVTITSSWQSDEEIPVIGTIAAQFNDPGVNELA